MNVYRYKNISAHSLLFSPLLPFEIIYFMKSSHLASFIQAQQYLCMNFLMKRVKSTNITSLSHNVPSVIMSSQSQRAYITIMFSQDLELLRLMIFSIKKMGDLDRWSVTGGSGSLTTDSRSRIWLTTPARRSSTRRFIRADTSIYLQPYV